MDKLQFYGEIVVFEQENNPQQVGDILLPSTAKNNDDVRFGKVTQLGVGRPGFSFTVKVGDRIIIPAGAQMQITIAGKV